MTGVIPAPSCFKAIGVALKSLVAAERLTTILVREEPLAREELLVWGGPLGMMNGSLGVAWKSGSRVVVWFWGAVGLFPSSVGSAGGWLECSVVKD